MPVPMPHFLEGLLGFADMDFLFEAEAGVIVAGAAPTAAAATTTTTTTVPTTALYLTEAGNTTAIAVSDINQGQIGDCFLLAAIGDLVVVKPSDITSMIKSNTDGSETVTLYESSTGSVPTVSTTAFKAVQINVTNVFPINAANNAITQDVLNGTKEIWVQVLEKAVATLDGGYNTISNGGSVLIAMEELTGKAAAAVSLATTTASSLAALVKAGDIIAFDTATTTAVLPYNLISNHAYFLESVTTTAGVTSVMVGNPWGFVQATAIPVTKLASTFIEMDVGKPA